jgi:hypothetical protein
MEVDSRQWELSFLKASLVSRPSSKILKLHLPAGFLIKSTTRFWPIVETERASLMHRNAVAQKNGQIEWIDLAV